ncbi:MAG: hypothetical protein ACR2JW_05875 [Thermomicrobiales bacterium]
MRTLKCIVVGVTVLLVAALSASVSAGGWAVATLDAMPTFVAEHETTVGFTLRQHGNTLLPGIRPSEIIFRNAQSGQLLTFPAPDDGPQGHYAARITLPEAGTWEWTINAFGDHPMPAVTATSGVAPLASAAPTRWAAVPLRLAYPGMAILAILAGVSFALGWRWRDQQRRSPRPRTAAFSPR